MIDHFEIKAADYEKNSKRVQNVINIAEKINAAIHLDKSMHLMDFGSGTGLLLEQIAPSVKTITAVDVSPSMMEQLLAKKDRIQCELKPRQLDLETEKLNEQFDGIISSMTLHHIKDVPAMLKDFWHMLPEGGFVALADLDTEDGSFHTEDTGVQHFGFDRTWFEGQLSLAGFKNIHSCTANEINKPTGDYTVFLVTATK